MSDTVAPGTIDPGTIDAGARLRAFVLSMPAARLLGFDFLDVAPGHVVLDLPFRPELGEHQGLFQGGILGALVDFAGASANATLLGPSEALMTLDYTVKLLRPARAAGLRAIGRVIDGGGRIGVGGRVDEEEADRGVVRGVVGGKGKRVVVVGTRYCGGPM